MKAKFKVGDRVKAWVGAGYGWSVVEYSVTQVHLRWLRRPRYSIRSPFSGEMYNTEPESGLRLCKTSAKQRLLKKIDSVHALLQRVRILTEEM